MTHSREQLNQHERALAERLSRISGTGGPSSALDARILSAAQATVAAQPENTDRPPADAKATGGVTTLQRPAANNTHPRRTSRWGWGLGMAASLTLAVGIAWQLRPQHAPTVVDQTAPAPTTRASSQSPSQASATPMVQSSGTSTAPTTATEESRAPVRTQPTPPPARAKASPLPAKPPIGAMADHAPVRLAHQRQLRATTSPTQQLAPIADNVRPLIETQSRTLATAAAVNEAEEPSVAMHAAVDQDARLPVDAWLRAIRRHRFEGQDALARASLQAFQTAHPDQAVPEDLRALLP